MSTVTVPVATSAPPTSRPYLALGLTFLLLGVGFGMPIALVGEPPEMIWHGAFARETLNLYALTAFLGWGHFVYAWRGQWKGSLRYPVRKRVGYWAGVFALLLALLGLRAALGVAVFSLAAWLYNIAHFVKAETYFAGGTAQRGGGWAPTIAFGWFTLCLFQVGPLANLQVVFAGSLLLAALALCTGDWKALAANTVRVPLLTLFLLGETMVWAAYSPYMAQTFRVGVYIFHIGAASFFHYLSGYFYAESRNARVKDRMLAPVAILTVNLSTVAIGIAVGWRPELRWLRPAFGLEWFTLWVALHLAASDLQPWWGRTTR